MQTRQKIEKGAETTVKTNLCKQEPIQADKNQSRTPKQEPQLEGGHAEPPTVGEGDKSRRKRKKMEKQHRNPLWEIEGDDIEDLLTEVPVVHYCSFLGCKRKFRCVPHIPRHYTNAPPPLQYGCRCLNENGYDMAKCYCSNECYYKVVRPYDLD
jgi:hypothetical protein